MSKLDSKTKISIIEQHAKKENTGLPEVQIAFLTEEINIISKHIQKNKKDFISKRSLHKKVSQRRSHLEYLRDTNINRYRAIIEKLHLRG
ncbi:MAG: 30S ribosomal protein S15 [Mycoplasmataceae bacterium]|jgi:small subunit ribosomal protein S15|nr:30S ribosomal protein S15 [Mycoplasmataceae bacterium]